MTHRPKSVSSPKHEPIHAASISIRPEQVPGTFWSGFSQGPRLSEAETIRWSDRPDATTALSLTSTPWLTRIQSMTDLGASDGNVKNAGAAVIAASRRNPAAHFDPKIKHKFAYFST